MTLTPRHLTLAELKFEAIFQRLSRLDWDRHDTAKSLDISVECLRGLIRQMKGRGYIVVDPPGSQRCKAADEIIRDAFSPISGHIKGAYRAKAKAAESSGVHQPEADHPVAEVPADEMHSTSH